MCRALMRLTPIAVLLSALVFASSSAARPLDSYLSYTQAATYQVPVPPDAVENGWCYDTATIDPRTHVYYLADEANKQVTVIDPRTARIGGIGRELFTGIGGCHQFNYDTGGPDGTAISGGHLFAANGNSHVLVFSLRTRRLIADVDTGGVYRADEMTIADGHLVVANPAESPHPYLSFINLRTLKIDAKFTFEHAIGGLEQPGFWRGHLYISVPQTTRSPNGGEVDELDIADPHAVHIVRSFRFGACQPAGLAVRADGVAAVGCGGPDTTSQEILNLGNGEQTAVPGVSGVDIVDVYGPDFFYVSYAQSGFYIANRAGRVVQEFPATPASHTVTVDPRLGTVWVPEDKGVVNVYSPSW